jgi:hypothetical protein
MTMADHDSPHEKPGDGMNKVMLLVSVIAMSVEPFLRYGFGHRYFDRRALLVIPWMMLVTMFWVKYDVTGLNCMFGGWFAMCAWNRLSGLYRHYRRGEAMPHSYYDGTPRLMRWFARIPGLGRLSERVVKRAAEPTVVFALAMLLRPFDAPLGGYLLLVAFALFVKAVATAIAHSKHLDDYRDAVIEQQYLRGRYQQVYGTR